jgi:hypothetical protein
VLSTKETGFERLQLLSEAVNEADVSHRGIVTAPPPSQPPPTTPLDQGPI